MNLPALYDEIFTVLAAADIGLHVPDDGPGVRAGVPAPYIELPEVMYGDAGTGLSRIPDLTLTVVVGQANNANVFRAALDYAASGQPQSVKDALEAHTWTNCDTVFVKRAEPDVEPIQGSNALLMYHFHIDVTGRP